MELRQVISTELARATAGVFISSPRARVTLQASEAQCRGDRAILTVGCSPRFLPQQFGAVCGNDSSRFSMHLRSHNLPRPSASSPPDKRSHPMANTSQVPDLEGLHREVHDMAEQMRIMNENNGRLMQLLTAANPHLQQHHPSLISSDLATLIGRGIVLTTSRRGRSPHRGDHIRARDKSTSQKIRDLDARLNAINTGTNTPVTVDTLIKQTEPPFTRRILRARISSKFKLPTQLGIYEGKTDPMDHLDSYKSLMSLQGCSDEVMCKAFSATLKGPARSWFRKLSPGIIDSFGELSRLFVANFMSCRNRHKNASHLFTVHQKETESLKDFVKRFNQAILEVEDPSDKVIIMAMMEGLRPGPLFDSLSKNVPKTLSALQSKAAEELAEAKRRRRGKDDHKRKEPDTRRDDHREETRGYLRKYIANRPPPNSLKRRYGDNRPTTGNIQTIHGGFGSGGYSTSSREKACQECLQVGRRRDLQSLIAICWRPTTHYFQQQRFKRLAPTPRRCLSGLSRHRQFQYKLHPFHTPLIGFGGNTTHPLGWINLPITLGTEPHQITVWQDFIVVDCPSPYNAILGRPTLGGIKVITSTYHLKNMGRDIELLRDEVKQLTLADPRETNNTKPLEEVVSISIHPDYPDRHIMIGTELADELRSTLVNFLKKNYDLIRANIVREAHYPDWLANVVVAPQKGGKWRVCVDFTDLNKACPKDSFPLPKIDLIVDATSKHELLSFMDAFSEYHQIKMYPPDIEKTSIITEWGLYCYKVMPFGLKNAGTTYQRLVNKMFKEQIGKTMEVYIDDMLVKSIRSSDHIGHLEEAFSILRRHRMMLNPSKCIFGVSSGKFLGFLVTKRGIEVNPDQIQALTAMSSPRNIREVQQLTGRVAALNRFVSKSVQLKEYLWSPPLLTVPIADEDLYIYLSISPTAVSAVLIREEDRVQRPIYYVSKVLIGVEARYPKIEKLAYALMIAARKLRHYFQAHPIIVLTDQPLKHILQRPDTSGRLLKWSIELSEFHIEYKPRTAIKAQALADFIVESTHEDTPQPEIAPPEAGIPKEPTSEKDLPRWILFVDDSSNQHGCGAGLVIQALSGEQMEYAIRMEFKATNNEAEYEALLAGLRIAAELGAQSLDIFSDSQLVVNQVQGEYLAKDARMIAYLGEVKAASARIKEVKIYQMVQIPWEENKKVDALANLASTFEFLSDRCIPLEFLTSPSIGVANQILQTKESPTWMDEIIAYLQGGTLPKDKLQARRLQYRSAKFCIFKGRLYKRSYSGPLLKCLRPEEAEYVLKEIHEGICGNHSGALSLARKIIIRQGYFWPTIERDAATYTKKCDKCQRFATVSHLPHTEMVPMSSPWPFAQWGIDILGPLPQAPLQRKFGIPKVIISDNARQFDNDKFRIFCSDLAISHHFSSLGHPQADGQVEVTNRTILGNLKARLERSKSEWAEDLPSILWAYHTTSRIPTGETPYSMVFGTESVIPVEIGMPSFRTSNFDEESNEAELRLNLDLLEEKEKRPNYAKQLTNAKSPNTIIRGSNIYHFFLAT
ncbi:hypothetical protein Acr_00g0050430 [Actinidia rufa]|uniref:Uncharacterized protein n=1 Tax=Actinidia rufa TaxID=165716 RepID=A0A7J0DMF5_9ERIC|nr:hypothetical protein Acr_00g0050430 [Actinidia rufa]